MVAIIEHGYGDTKNISCSKYLVRAMVMESNRQPQRSEVKSILDSLHSHFGLGSLRSYWTCLDIHNAPIVEHGFMIKS